MSAESKVRRLRTGVILIVNPLTLARELVRQGGDRRLVNIHESAAYTRAVTTAEDADLLR